MSQALPFVSIVLCTYNGAAYLRPQIESLLQQDYDNFEILISDDKSTDDTLAIASDYAAQDSRIRIHVNEVNKGYNQNFESAFALAAGDFIAVCDQDDIWKKNKISELMKLFTSEAVMLVYGQSVRFQHQVPEAEHYTARTLFEGSDLRQLMFFNTVAGHNMIFRKALLSLAPPFPKQVFYDWWLLILAAHYGRVKGSTAVYTFHRDHGNNLTLGKKDEKKQMRHKAEERMRTINAILHLPELNEPSKTFALRLRTALQTLEGREFSFTLFRFLLKERNSLFYFKKPSFISRAKMAWRLSYARS